MNNITDETARIVTQRGNKLAETAINFAARKGWDVFVLSYAAQRLMLYVRERLRQEQDVAAWNRYVDGVIETLKLPAEGLLKQ